MIVETANDESLAAAAAHGDLRSFNMLYARYRRVADRSAARAGRQLPQLDVEAASSQAMTRLWQSLSGYDPSMPFAPWAATVISRSVRTASEAARSNASRWNWGALLVRDDDDELQRRAGLGLAADEGLNPLSTVLLSEEEAIVAAVLAEVLSAVEAVVVRLRLAGWSYEEIAAVLGRDTKAVDNAQRRAMAKLRGTVAAHDGKDG